MFNFFKKNKTNKVKKKVSPRFYFDLIKIKKNIEDPSIKVVNPEDYRGNIFYDPAKVASQIINSYRLLEGIEGSLLKKKQTTSPLSIANLLVYNSDLQGPRGRVGEWCPNLEAAICLKVLFYCCDNYHPNYFQTINYTLEYFERFLNSLSFPVYELEKFKSQIRGSGYSIKGNEFPPRLKSKPGSVKRVVEDVGLKKRTPLEQDLSREDNWSPVGISKLEMKQFLVKKDLARKAKELAFKKYLKHNNFHEICQGESHGHGDYVLCPYSLAIPLFLKFGNPLKVSQEFLKGLKFVSFGGSNRILLCEYEKGIEGRYSSLNLSKNLIFRVSGNGQA